MLNIIREIKCNFQNEEEVKKIIEFEKKNNYLYDVICDNLIDARKLAMLLDEFDKAEFYPRRINGEYVLRISFANYIDFDKCEGDEL